MELQCAAGAAEGVQSGHVKLVAPVGRIGGRPPDREHQARLRRAAQVGRRRRAHQNGRRQHQRHVPVLQIPRPEPALLQRRARHGLPIRSRSGFSGYRQGTRARSRPALLLFN